MSTVYHHRHRRRRPDRRVFFPSEKVHEVTKRLEDTAKTNKGAKVGLSKALRETQTIYQQSGNKDNITKQRLT